MAYSLDVGAPAGASIHPATGVFSWTPSNEQPAGSYTVTLRVTDTGSPVMTDAQTFRITVVAPPELTLVLSGSNILLTWPDTGPAGAGFRAYTATNLSPPVTWLPVNATAVLSNGQWAVQLPAGTNTTQFFNLQTP